MNFLESLLSRSLVGLDIGVSSIKAIELSGGKNPRLIGYNRVQLPWDTLSPEGEIKRPAVVVEALKKLFGFKGFSSKRVAVGASGNAIITKKITVQKMSSAELQHQLYWEAEQYIPFNVNDVNLDFAILGPASSAGNTPQMEVLLVAAKKDYVQGMAALVEEAGLKMEVVDHQAFALGNSFEFNYAHHPSNSDIGAAYVIVDLGAGSTKVSVVEGDKTVFTRPLRQSGAGCTMMLAERLSISIDEAERRKILLGATEPIKSLLSEYAQMIADEVSRTIDFYLSQTQDKSITGVYTCGGGSRLEGLGEVMVSKLPYPVMALNPVQNIAGTGKKMNAQAIREISYLGAVAVGLALRTAGDSA